MCAASQSCQTLGLRFTNDRDGPNAARIFSLVLGTSEWLQVKRLEISGAVVDYAAADFLLKHLPALVELSMDHLLMRAHSCQTFFCHLASKLPKLWRFDLRAFFCSSSDDCRAFFFGLKLFGELKAAIERYIVEGGTCADLRVADDLVGAEFKTNMADYAEISDDETEVSPEISSQPASRHL